MTQIRPEYLYTYYCRLFKIEFTGDAVVVTCADGKELRRVECSALEVVRNVFYSLKNEFIFDYDKELEVK